MGKRERLDLDILPDLPQSQFLKHVAQTLWARDDVIAIWVGGSLATGEADPYSDVDLFIAVTPEALSEWLEPNWDALFDGRCLASGFSRFGERFYVHHLLLDTGDIYDLHVQPADVRFPPEPRLILGCRDQELRDTLAQAEREELPLAWPARAWIVQELLESYWLNAHKHRKVLARGLDLLILTGLQYAYSLMLRLYYILATGDDCGDLRRGTIHTLTPIVRTLQDAFGDRILRVIGQPLRSRAEICEAIEILNEEAGRVGRELARRYEFEYPAELESLVTRYWEQFKREVEL